MDTLRIEQTATQPQVSQIGREVLLTVVASSALALLAQLSFPIGPIPITGQTLGVLGLAWALGRVRAINAVSLYLAQGAAGLPVFAGGTAGAAVLLGPTGGYLMGFLLAAVVVGAVSDRARISHRQTSGAIAGLAFAAGTVCVYVPGLLLLSRFLPDGVLAAGLFPFLPGDAIKVLLLVALLPVLNRFSDTR